jgi:hypothetical protein
MMIGLGIETTLDDKAVPPERALDACRLALSLFSVSPD